MSPWHVDVTRLVNILVGQVFRAHQDRDGVPRNRWGWHWPLRFIWSTQILNAIYRNKNSRPTMWKWFENKFNFTTHSTVTFAHQSEQRLLLHKNKKTFGKCYCSRIGHREMTRVVAIIFCSCHRPCKERCHHNCQSTSSPATLFSCCLIFQLSFFCRLAMHCIFIAETNHK